MSWLEGGCHCGRVRFRVRVDEREALDCNCSICTKKGFLHAIVSRDDFELVQGEDALTTYTFGTGGGASHVLSRVRDASLLRSAFAPRRHRRERALSR